MTDRPSLQRVIGVRALAANTINMTVGAGIFLLPALVAAQLGTAAVLAYLVCGAAMFLILLCFAESGSRVFESGGACAYVEAAFGPFAGFLVSTLYWLGYAVVSIAAVANGLLDTLSSVVPVLHQQVPRLAFLGAMFMGLAWINIRGAKRGARAVEILTLIKLLPLVGLVLIGSFFVHAENLAIETVPSLGTFGAATLMLFFAFGGAEASLTPSGEIRDPARTVPFGLLSGVAGILALYLGLQIVAQGVLGAQLANETEAPLAVTAQNTVGGLGATILLAGAAISMFATCVGDLLGSPRAVYASARDGILSTRLAAIHPTFRTPHMAIAFYGLMAFAFAATGAFQSLAVLSTVAILLVYLATVAATVVLRRRDVRASDRVFKLPGGPLIPGLAAAVILWLLSQAALADWIAVGAMIGIAALFYVARQSRTGAA